MTAATAKRFDPARNAAQARKARAAAQLRNANAVNPVAPHPHRLALKLVDAAIRWTEGGGKVSSDELKAIRAAIMARAEGAT